MVSIRQQPPPFSSFTQPFAVETKHLPRKEVFRGPFRGVLCEADLLMND